MAKNKKATIFEDLPVAERETEWNGGQARANVLEWAKEDMLKYAKAFFWYDIENAENLGAYKLPFADVIDGVLTAIPKGIMSAAGAVMGARGGVDIPEEDMDAVKAHIQKYYDKMEMRSPFEEEDEEEMPEEEEPMEEEKEKACKPSKKKKKNELNEYSVLDNIIKRTGVQSVRLLSCSIKKRAEEEMPKVGEDNWFLVAPKGLYNFSEFDVLDCNDEFCNTMINNFNKKVYQQEVPIDIDHDFGKSYGTIKELKHDAEGLKANIEFNEEGLELIRKRSYMYFSIAYAMEYCDPKMKGEMFENVLMAIALTNHPALKGQPIATITYSESLKEDSFENITNKIETKKEGVIMSDNMQIEIGKLKAEMDEKINEFSELKKTKEEQEVKIRTEYEEQIKTLSEQVNTMKAKETRENLTKRAEALIPQKGEHTFILRKEDIEKVVAFAEVLTEEQQEQFMTILSEMPAKEMPTEVLGVSGGTTEPTKENIEKEVQKVLSEAKVGEKEKMVKELYKKLGGIN
jgi:hypothetical protein